MKKSSSSGDIAIKDIAAWLDKLSVTLKVDNVELDKEYQKLDIDLIWHRQGLNKLFIEVKGDNYNTTGNYFFETISNASKGTQGCFLYTQADYLFYYFIYTRKLHILEIEPVRYWFNYNQSRFMSKFPSTTLQNGELYCSEGKIVPIHIVKREVGITKIIEI
jgi:hypothetical protein